MRLTREKSEATTSLTQGGARQEVLGEVQWSQLRLIIAHDTQVAMEAGAKRDKCIAELEKQAAQWVGKLDEQDAGQSKRGRKLSDGGARANGTYISPTPLRMRA